MKKYILILIASALALFAVSCKKESAGVTKITYYPVFELKGDNPLVVTVGSTFTDPGFTATLEGADITNQATVDSNVDASQMGVYEVSYSATNKDGYSYTATRTVIVANPGNIDNVYISETSMGTRSYSGCITVITKETDGSYIIDDLCAGFYYYGRYPGYEPTYNFHAKTKFTVDAATGAITVLGAWNWQFATSFDYSNITGGYDASTGIFKYNFDGLDVVLTPIA